MPLVRSDELDIAAAAGKVMLGRRNARHVRCCCCGILCVPGEAKACWIDGHDRGYLCTSCGKVVD